MNENLKHSFNAEAEDLEFAFLADLVKAKVLDIDHHYESTNAESWRLTSNVSYPSTAFEYVPGTHEQHSEEFRAHELQAQSRLFSLALDYAIFPICLVSSRDQAIQLVEGAPKGSRLSFWRGKGFRARENDALLLLLVPVETLAEVRSFRASITRYRVSARVERRLGVGLVMRKLLLQTGIMDELPLDPGCTRNSDITIQAPDGVAVRLPRAEGRSFVCLSGKYKIVRTFPKGGNPFVQLRLQSLPPDAYAPSEGRVSALFGPVLYGARATMQFLIPLLPFAALLFYFAVSHMATSRQFAGWLAFGATLVWGGIVAPKPFAHWSSLRNYASLVNNDIERHAYLATCLVTLVVLLGALNVEVPGPITFTLLGLAWLASCLTCVLFGARVRSIRRRFRPLHEMS